MTVVMPSQKTYRTSYSRHIIAEIPKKGYENNIQSTCLCWYLLLQCCSSCSKTKIAPNSMLSTDHYIKQFKNKPSLFSNNLPNTNTFMPLLQEEKTVWDHH
jgi:hypothetical protein